MALEILRSIKEMKFWICDMNKVCGIDVALIRFLRDIEITFTEMLMNIPFEDESEFLKIFGMKSEDDQTHFVEKLEEVKARIAVLKSKIYVFSVSELQTLRGDFEKCQVSDRMKVPEAISGKLIVLGHSIKDLSEDIVNLLTDYNLPMEIEQELITRRSSVRNEHVEIVIYHHDSRGNNEEEMKNFFVRLEELYKSYNLLKQLVDNLKIRCPGNNNSVSLDMRKMNATIELAALNKMDGRDLHTYDFSDEIGEELLEFFRVGVLDSQELRDKLVGFLKSKHSVDHELRNLTAKNEKEMAWSRLRLEAAENKNAVLEASLIRYYNISKDRKKKLQALQEIFIETQSSLANSVEFAQPMTSEQDEKRLERVLK